MLTKICSTVKLGKMSVVVVRLSAAEYPVRDNGDVDDLGSLAQHIEPRKFPELSAPQKNCGINRRNGKFHFLFSLKVTFWVRQSNYNIKLLPI